MLGTMTAEPERRNVSGDRFAGVAVFPLPQAVLFPGGRLPLHIFEPRYRAMMADVLAGGTGLMVIAQLKPGWRQDYAGQPPIFPLAGIGRIERSQRNADGTYDLELHGLARVELEELPMLDKPYRRANATRLSDLAPRAGLHETELTSLFSLATQVAALVRNRAPRFRLLATPADPPGLLMDKIADQLVGDPVERLRLLGMLELGERLEAVTSQVAQLQLTLLAGEDNGALLH
jgi:Lon protease-like protein